MIDYLDKYIGQNKNRSEINFFIENQRKTGFLPPLFLSGARGYGKSLLTREIQKNLIDRTGNKKKYLEVHCSSVSSLKDFVEQIIKPHVLDSEITVNLEELHLLPLDVKNWLLYLLPTEGKTSSANYSNEPLNFNFNNLSLIGSTTNPEQLSLPILSRFHKIELEPYKLEEITKIIHSTSPIRYNDDVDIEIAKISRATPRLARNFVMNRIAPYCANLSKNSFGATDWDYFKSVFNIQPFGLTNQEIEYLKYITTPKTLTCISARLNLDSSTVRKHIESYLLSEGLIEIDGKRKITGVGQKILNNLS